MSRSRPKINIGDGAKLATATIFIWADPSIQPTAERAHQFNIKRKVQIAVSHGGT